MTTRHHPDQGPTSASTAGGPARLAALLLLTVLAGCVRMPGPGGLTAAPPNLRPLRPATPPVAPSVSVAFDKEGNRVAAGTFSRSIRVGDQTLESAGGTDIYLIKTDKTGKVLLAQRFGGKADQAVTDLAVDPAGNLILAGKTAEPIDIGGVRLAPQLRGETQRALFVAKLDATGKGLWIREAGIGNDSAILSVAAAPDGRIALGVGLVGPLIVGGKVVASAGQSLSIGDFTGEGTSTAMMMFVSAPEVACAHAPCAMGQKLDGMCDWCVALVCTRDPFCCNNAWDQQCVFEVGTICGQRCDCNVCNTGQPISAYACACTGSICGADPYCCANGWDGVCKSQVGAACAIACPR